MADVSAIPSANTITGSLQDPSFLANRDIKKSLSQADFIKLLTVQLSNQNPMEPVNNQEFIAQMATFSNLEQTSSMRDTMKAFSYFGKEVTLKDNVDSVTGTVSPGITGMVTGVKESGGSMKISIDGQGLFTLDQVQDVRLPASSTSVAKTTTPSTTPTATTTTPTNTTDTASTSDTATETTTETTATG